MSFQTLLADHLLEQSTAHAHAAADDPDDARNLTASWGLRLAAVYVRRLPPADARLAALAARQPRGAKRYKPTDAASRVIRSFRYDDPAEAESKWLDRLASTAGRA